MNGAAGPEREARRAAMLAEVRVIAARLNEQAASIVKQLLPNFIDDRTWYRVKNLAGDRGTALCIDVTGSTCGQWTDFASTKGMDGHSGDMLDLVARVRFGGRKKDAIAWARSYLGMDDLDPARLAVEQAKVCERAKASDAEARRKAEANLRAARGLFLAPRRAGQAGAVPIVDTPAEWYFAARGIDLACLEIAGARYVPRALAFHPAVPCGELDGQRLPAMIARVLDGKGVHIATHRTFLAERPAGWGKAQLAGPKATLGSYRDADGGGYIPLWKGACRKTLAEISAGTDVYVSEGIEDGLSVACARPELRVIAAIALSNMGNIVLPPQAGRMVIIAQNDPPGSPAAIALAKSIERQQARGRKVAIVRMPAGVKDANDVLRGGLVQRTEAA